MHDTPALGRLEILVREKSKGLLGAQFRAEIAAYVAVADEPYWARSIATALAIPENKSSTELSRFAEHGLLTPMTGVDTWDRRRLFVKSPTSKTYWQMALDLVANAAKVVADGEGLDGDSLLAAYLARVHRADSVMADRVL